MTTGLNTAQINTWVSGNVTSSVLGVTTWRWGIAMFAIIYPGESIDGYRRWYSNYAPSLLYPSPHHPVRSSLASETVRRSGSIQEHVPDAWGASTCGGTFLAVGCHWYSRADCCLRPNSRAVHHCWGGSSTVEDGQGHCYTRCRCLLHPCLDYLGEELQVSNGPFQSEIPFITLSPHFSGLTYISC